jgi:N-ethylmaleimide reductase
MKLFTPFALGPLELKNRVVMAPMTRSRAAGPDPSDRSALNLPNSLMASYYGARASAGLIVTEGTSPSPNGLGYARIPGLFNSAHVEGWRKVTSAVHANGGKIFVQLMHVGRVAHPANMPAQAQVVAPAAIEAPGEMWTDSEGMRPHPRPIAMDEERIEAAIEEFARSAALAIEAGFDGVELHGANGYLIDQFLNTASNQRTDRWGGSIANRARFVLAVAERVSRRIGAERVGIRLSPYGVFNGMAPDPEMHALYDYLAEKLSELRLAYLHLVDHSSMGAPEVPLAIKASMRERFRGAFILSGGYDAARAKADLDSGLGDLVAFGRPFIANPDLVEKLRDGGSLRQPDPATFYTPGEKGYTDY